MPGTLRTHIIFCADEAGWIRLCCARRERVGKEDHLPTVAQSPWTSLTLLSQSNNYSDATNLPKVLKDWQCETCITSKSIKRKPTAITDKRSDTPFELIHSDLSGKFFKTSFGKSNYYVTFIDDCTRYAWIYPIHATSDTVTVFTSFIYPPYTQDNAIIK